jgi:hypothetical protein
MDERSVGIQKLFSRCAEYYQDQAIARMPFNTKDRGSDRLEYSMAYHRDHPERRRFCGPDFAFVHWPSAHIHHFPDTRDAILAASRLAPTIDKVGWFGNIWSPDLTDTHVIEVQTRPLLHLRGYENSQWMDIVHVARGQPNPPLSLPELCRYRYLIDIGGNGYSGRLKYLLFSKRPLLLVDRIYVEYFHHELIPYVHYVPVKMDLSDLVEKVLWLRNHPQEGEAMAAAAQEFALQEFTEQKLIERVASVFQSINSNKF